MINNLIKKNTRFLPSIFLLIILISLVYQLVISNIINIKAKKIEDYNFYYKNNFILSNNNQELLAKLDKINANSDVFESVARYEFGFIKKNEKYYTYPLEDSDKNSNLKY